MLALRTPSVAPVLFGLTLLAIGCQGSAPTAPKAPAATTPAPQSFAGLALPDTVAPLGAFTATIDPVALTAALAPWRAGAAIGDVYHEIGVTQALKDNAAFTVDGVRRIDADTIGLTLSARHPFPLATRPDLSVFNLKVHTVVEGSEVIGFQTFNPTFLENPDGFSTIWDLQAEQDRATAANLHPYRILSLDPTRPATFDPFAPSGYNVWAPGSTVTTELELRLTAGDPPTAVNLYLTCDYGQSAIRSTRDMPAYELPRFAGKAPWKVVATVTENTLAANDRDSFITVGIEVRDWGHNAGLDTDILAVEATIPALDVTESINTIPAEFADPLTFDLTLVNANTAPEGLHWGLVTVTDAAAGGLGLEDDLITSFAVSSYHTYAVFPVVVGPPTGNPPTAVISAPCGDVTWWPATIPIDFSGQGSFDMETTPDLLVYEWDLDYSGVPSEFEVDRMGSEFTWSWAEGTEGEFTIALRVTDEESLTHIETYLLRVTTVPGGPFANRTNLTNTPDRKEDIGRSQTGFDRDHMAIDADGNVHIFTLISFFDTEVTTYNFTTQTSTGPELLYETEYLYSVPIVRTAPDGTVHLLYMAADRFNDNGYEKPSIGWRTYDPVTRTVSEQTIIAEYFTPNPQEPTSNIPHMQGISFDIDQNNNMVAVYEEWWADSVPANKETSYAANMFYIRGTSAGGWEPATVVPWSTFTAYGDPFGSAGWKRARPDIRVTDDNLFHAVYLYNPDEDLDGPLPMWHRVYDYAEDTWGAPIVAVEDAVNRTYAQVQLFPAPGGNLVMTSQSSFDKSYFSRYTQATNSWLQPVRIADATTTAGIAWHSLPTAAVTPDGTVFMAFQALNPAPLDDLEEFYYKYFPFDATPEDIFNAPNVPLVPCIGPEGQREPQMVVDPAHDRLVIVYEDPEDVPENDLWIAWKALP